MIPHQDSPPLASRHTPLSLQPQLSRNHHRQSPQQHSLPPLPPLIRVEVPRRLQEAARVLRPQIIPPNHLPLKICLMRLANPESPPFYAPLLSFLRLLLRHLLSSSRIAAVRPPLRRLPLEHKVFLSLLRVLNRSVQFMPQAAVPA